ncbi:MAG: nuclear transport factor 2 family protein [Anaerolineales bacterium]|jgi:ketosteroid isomerase-like protein
MSSDEDVRTQVRAVLTRFNDLVVAKNPQVVAEFASGNDVLLVGSESGEIAKGRQELEAFFARIFARETSFSWEWDRLEAAQAGDLAWFFAEGRVILTTSAVQRMTPYRISGVLKRRGDRWLWQLYHGSEPVSGT